VSYIYIALLGENPVSPRLNWQLNALHKSYSTFAFYMLPETFLQTPDTLPFDPVGFPENYADADNNFMH